MSTFLSLRNPRRVLLAAFLIFNFVQPAPAEAGILLRALGRTLKACRLSLAGRVDRWAGEKELSADAQMAAIKEADGVDQARIDTLGSKLALVNTGIESTTKKIASLEEQILNLTDSLAKVTKQHREAAAADKPKIEEAGREIARRRTRLQSEVEMRKKTLQTSRNTYAQLRQQLDAMKKAHEAAKTKAEVVMGQLQAAEFAKSLREIEKQAEREFGKETSSQLDAAVSRAEDTASRIQHQLDLESGTSSGTAYDVEKIISETAADNEWTRIMAEFTPEENEAFDAFKVAADNTASALADASKP